MQTKTCTKCKIEKPFMCKSDREPTKHELFKQELRIKLFKLKSQEIKLI